MTIKQKLQLIRNLSGLTQESLAKKLGVSFPTINSWINGKSIPRRKAKENINNLYFEFTGQKNIPDDFLTAKKQIIKDKAKKHKNVLKELIENPDIYDQFLLSLTYHTNKLEGSTLTEDETKAILFDNIALKNKSMTEQLEAKNHQTALQYLFKHLIAPSSKVNEELILKLHSILMNGIKTDAGFYRGHGVRIVGTNVPTANYLKVPALMKQIAQDISYRGKDIVLHITKIHSRFEQIHPFSDGNGRIGRLLMNAMLLKNNFPPAVVRQEKKRVYNDCLKKSQLQENFLPLEEFFYTAILEGFKILERK